MLSQPGKDVVVIMDFPATEMSSFIEPFGALIELLTETDRLSVYSTFDSSPKIAPFMKMDEINKLQILKHIK